MDFQLDSIETRVLASLLEKEITTPEYYPLTLNALVNACNQKSNRDPMVSFTADDVTRAIATLREKQLALLQTSAAGSRVPKYGHRITEKLNLGRRELAVLCELMLRGPQTLGELRNRADRMHDFADIEEVESVVRALSERGMVTRIEPHAGMKEPRYAHLLSGEPVLTVEPGHPRTEPGQDRIASLEAEVGALKDQVRALEEQWEAFRRQFE